MRWSQQLDPDVDVWWPTSVYLLGTDEVVLSMSCTTDDARPEDDRLSIVETIELEGGPSDSSPDLAETLVRVEVPEAGIEPHWVSWRLGS